MGKNGGPRIKTQGTKRLKNIWHIVMCGRLSGKCFKMKLFIYNCILTILKSNVVIEKTLVYIFFLNLTYRKVA